MSFNLANYLEATDAPHWITHNSAWIYHIPMAPVLVKMLRPRTFVELGTFRGDSYMAFCQAVAKIGTNTHCTAVDNWRGDAHAGFYGPDILRELQTTHDPLYGRFSQLLQADFTAALAHFPDGSIDLLHIDGHHTYEAVRADFEAWRPKLSEQGVVLLHDTQVREKDFGVWRLWEDLVARWRGFDVPYGCGLGMLAVGAHVPRVFTHFLEELNQDPLPILTQLQTLGMRIELTRTLMALANDLHNDQSILNEWRRLRGQAIAQPTPDPKSAWDNPRKYSQTVFAETRDLAVEAVQLTRQVKDLERQLSRTRIGVVPAAVEATKEKAAMAQAG